MNIRWALFVAAAGVSAAQPAATLQQAAEPVVYRVASSGRSFYADNPANRLKAEFLGAGTTVRAGAAELKLSIAGYGWGGKLTTPGEVTAIAADGQRLTRRYSTGLAEWFVNRSQGLEQGFEIARRGGTGTLRLRLAANSDWKVRDGAEGVIFSRGTEQLRYAGLSVRDANGIQQPATMHARGDGVEIDVEEAKAVYPLTIDPTLSQLQQLTASDGAASDQFGSTVVMSKDGTTAAFGVSSHQVGSNAGQGAVYIFTQSGGAWTLQQELSDSSGVTNEYFGIALALSGNGNVLVVGDYLKSSRLGGGWVFTRTSGVWTQAQTLLGNDTGGSDQFGRGVACTSDGSLIMVGAFNANGSKGAVYTFTLNSGVWSQQQKLTASDGANQDDFGTSVYLSSDGTSAVIAASGKTVNGDSFQGAIYGFTQSSGVWSQQQELNLGVIPRGNGVSNDFLCRTGAISGDGNTLVCGSSNHPTGASYNVQSGAAFAFFRSSGTWSLQQQLNPSDGAQYDSFGTSVALSDDGNTVFIGSPGHKVGTTNYAGAVYPYTRSGATWTQGVELSLSTPIASGELGTAVATPSDASSLLIGAGYMNIGSNSYQGAAYAFGVALPVVSITAATSPSGLQLSVGGNTVTTPSASTQDIGHSLSLNAPSPQGSSGTQYVFSHWEDNSTSASRSITVPSTPTTYTATYNTQYELTTQASPAGAGNVSPSTGYQNAGQVSVSATPDSCHAFSGWSGATVTGGQINLAAPTTLTANFVAPQAASAIKGLVVTVRGAPITYKQTVQVTNNSGAAADVSIVLDTFGPSVVLTSPAATGTTSACTGTAGRYYYTVSNVANGAAASVTFSFTGPSSAGITYNASGIVGSGPR